MGSSCPCLKIKDAGVDHGRSTARLRSDFILAAAVLWNIELDKLSFCDGRNANITLSRYP